LGSIDPIMDLLGRRWEDLGLAWRILAGFEQQGRQKFCRKTDISLDWVSI